LRNLLRNEGIASTLYSPAPGRANLYALLKGKNSSAGSLIFTHHMDVVGADEEAWTHPPFSGEIVNGEIWGRGAIDLKGLGIAQLGAFIALKRSGIQLDRDTAYLAVSDEEVNGKHGTQWMLRHHPELFQNVAGVINEAGPGYLAQDGSVEYWEVMPSQKLALEVKLTAIGTPGHGSLPFANSAPNRLVRALDRIRKYKTPVIVLPEVASYFKQIARFETGERRDQLKNLPESLKNRKFYRWFVRHLQWNAMVRNTISITGMEGSSKVNVIPAEASAVLDCRLLPSQDPKTFLDALRSVIDDNHVSVTCQNDEAQTPSAPVDSPLFNMISNVIDAHFPKTPVVSFSPFSSNDNRFYLQHGINAYGFFPFLFSRSELDRMHGNDERISVENMKLGVKMLYDIAVRFAGSSSPSA